MVVENIMSKEKIQIIFNNFNSALGLLGIISAIFSFYMESKLLLTLSICLIISSMLTPLIILYKVPLKVMLTVAFICISLERTATLNMLIDPQGTYFIIPIVFISAAISKMSGGVSIPMVNFKTYNLSSR